MKFDVLIIGGGLAGLVCGIRLVQEGKSCVIVSAGQSALHFSSGSFDLLNKLPDGTFVERPLDALDVLIKQSPAHPYAKIGVTKMREYVPLIPELFRKAGVFVKGGSDKNHYRLTPMGSFKPTWLTLDSCVVSTEADVLPWKRAALFNIAGFLDCYVQFIADEFKKLGTECSVNLFNMKALEHLRNNPSEMRSANIARVFEKQENLEELGRILQAGCKEAEVVLLPAVFGLERNDALDFLRNILNREVVVLPTMPPSVPGISAQLRLRKYFQNCGGVYMLGDNIMKADVTEKHVGAVYSYNHGDIPFVVKDVVLATGSFFSQGLIAEPDRVYEPIFGLDVNYTEDRETWFDKNFFNKQPYQSFGVKTDSVFHGVKNGQILDNLYVAGAILDGFDAIKDGCGGGVSILTALEVANQIIAKY